ncbi:hypothetical protein KQX54_019309 [Cotesia glomerata]|uniref:Uncharacterized protein n=1 Tax=Cotesia glomerata TaxID=32391 RepID=A0AAV7HZN9_COTGL|nr:hypothetical protein KQX54_019309 [Cotesia glomerata]
MDRPKYNLPAEIACLQKYFDFNEDTEKVKNVNERIWYPKFGNPTLLQLAIFYNHGKFVKFLLEKNADVNIVTELWGTALHVAVKLRRFHMMQNLFHAGAIIDKLASKKNCTPIYYLFEKEEGEKDTDWQSIIILFIKKGLDVDQICIRCPPEPSMTLLDVALKNKEIKAVKILLDVGASVDRVDDSGRTPLEKAEIFESEESKELISDYIIKLRMVGLPVSDRNWKAVAETNYRKFNDLKLECMQEIQLMKDLTDPAIGITYDKVFSKSEEELKIFKTFLRSDIVAFYDNIRPKFKIYFEIMVRQVRYVTDINLSDSERQATAEYYEKRKNLKDLRWINKRLECSEYGDPTLLQFAVFCEDELFVCQLLQRKANVHFDNVVWGTALHIAVRQHKMTIIEMLLKAGARVDKLATKFNCTPIFHLLRYKNAYWVDIVHLLIKYGVNINDVCVEDYDNKTQVPLEVAIVNGNEVAVKSLLEMGADIDQVNPGNNMIPLQLIDTYSNLPNFMTIREIIMNHIVVLLTAGVKVSGKNRDAVSRYNDDLIKSCTEEIESMQSIKYPNTGLTYYEILTKSDQDLVKIFLTKRKSVKHKEVSNELFGNYGQIVSNKIFRVNVLVKARLSINYKIMNRPKYNLPADIACLQKYFDFNEDTEKVKNVNERIWYPKFGNPTLLQLAIFYNHEKFANYLLEKNADVNIVTEFWGTALHVAVKLRRFHMMQNLFHAGAIIDKLASKKNCTPIYYLFEKEEGEKDTDWQSIIILFIKKGLDVDQICIRCPPEPSMTLLDVALKNKETKAVKILLDVGASVDRVDDSGRTPLEKAEIFESEESKELISDYIIKLRMVGLPVSDRNWKAVAETNYRKFNDLKLECMQEIQLMKDLTDPAIGITYDKVFSKSEEELKIFKTFLRSDIVAFYDNIRTTFKIYFEIMVRQVRYVTDINLSDSERQATAEYYEKRKNLKDVRWINKRLECSEYGHPTLLQFAVFCEDEIFVSQLLQRKANVHLDNIVWGTALHIAVRQHKMTIVVMLLEAGANVDKFATNLNCTPIFHLLRHKNAYWIDIVYILITYGVNINDVCVEDFDKKQVPLEVAIVNGNEVAVKSLLEMGADIDQVNSRNNLMPLQLIDTYPNSPNFLTIREIIMNYIVMLLTAGVKVSERNRDAVAGFNDDLIKSCTEEIESMKSIIYPNTELTYYEILTKSDQDLVKIFLTKRKSVKHKVALNEFFRNYGQIVSNKIFRVNVLVKARRKK